MCSPGSTPLSIFLPNTVYFADVRRGPLFYIYPTENLYIRKRARPEQARADRQVWSPKTMQVVEGIPVITYHSIDDSGSIISTSPAIFRRQMQFLSENGFRTLTLGALGRLIGSGERFPDKRVVITFDDGFENFYSRAFPLLDSYGFDSTVFLVAGQCGRYNDWEGNPAKLPRSRILSWNQVKELSSSGVDFGSHTLTHPNLTSIPIESAEVEMVKSREKIEDMIGRAVDNFAYPYGKFNEAILRIAKRMYSTSCSTKLGKAAHATETFSIERIDSYYLTHRFIYERLLTPSFDRYIGCRNGLRLLKQQVLGH
jgi:hypothetical protein